MAKLIPNSVIGAVAGVIAAHYYSHSKVDALFMRSGAPGDKPIGNLETKCMEWLKRCNDDPTLDALAVLGSVIQEFMDSVPPSYAPEKMQTGQQQIRESLAKNQLAYQINGHITLAGSTTASKTLADYPLNIISARSSDFHDVLHKN